MNLYGKTSLQLNIRDIMAHGSGVVPESFDFATLAHDGQKRKSGERFINHPKTVSETLLFGDWMRAVVAGLLHDTIEDGGATRDDIVTEFGESVALLVDGVTKITNIRLKGSTQEQL